MKIYAYILPHDTGFAPCYADGIWTLACCKPQMRRNIYKLWHSAPIYKAQEEDIWVMGMKHGDKTEDGFSSYIVYAAKIKEVLNREHYFDEKGEFADRADCIYTGVPKSEENPSAGLIDRPQRFYRGIPSEHELPENPTKEQIERASKDIKGNCVLYSDHFFYFHKDKEPEKVWNIMEFAHEKCKARRPGDYFFANKDREGRFCDKSKEEEFRCAMEELKDDSRIFCPRKLTPIDYKRDEEHSKDGYTGKLSDHAKSKHCGGCGKKRAPRRKKTCE